MYTNILLLKSVSDVHLLRKTKQYVPFTEPTTIQILTAPDVAYFDVLMGTGISKWYTNVVKQYL